jgi:hypothetical protein
VVRFSNYHYKPILTSLLNFQYSTDQPSSSATIQAQTPSIVTPVPFDTSEPVPESQPPIPNSSATNQAQTESLVAPVPFDTPEPMPESEPPLPTPTPGAPFDKSLSNYGTTVSSFPPSITETFVPTFREPSSPLAATSPSQISSPSDTISASPAESIGNAAQVKTSALHTIIGVSVGGGLALVLLVFAVVAARVRYRRISDRERETEMEKATW